MRLPFNHLIAARLEGQHQQELARAIGPPCQML